MKEIEIYTLPNCPACKRLKETLSKEKIEYVNKDTKEFDEEWKDVQRTTKTYFLPTIKIGDTYLSPNRDFKNDEDAIRLIKDAMDGNLVESEMGPVELRETMKTLLFQFEMVNRGMGNMGKAIDTIREFSRMPREWTPEPAQGTPAQGTPPVQQKPIPPVTPQ
tara:strand:- start:2 stop:490 length:489 start_codon:yes stop_codon:yes gene_type:complete